MAVSFPVKATMFCSPGDGNFGKPHEPNHHQWKRGGQAEVEKRGVAPIKRRTKPTGVQQCRGSVVMGINNFNQAVMDVDSSRNIVEDYIRYSLKNKGLDWQNGQRDMTPNEIQRAMRALGDEFETRFSGSFDNMMNQLHITPDEAHRTFKSIVDEIFANGVNWGRIVALFGFSGNLAVRCVQQSMPQLVDNIVDWVSTYVDTNLREWIAEHNGWAGFLEFYNRGPEERSKESWPTLKTVCSFAAAGLGILTLGAFLAQKS